MASSEGVHESLPRVGHAERSKSRTQEVDMHRFLIVIENAGKNFSAYSPDLPGCVATRSTREETECRMSEAIQMHVQGLLEDQSLFPCRHRLRNTSCSRHRAVGLLLAGHWQG